MSHSIDHFTKPLSPAEAFCIGGIVSSCDVHRIDSRTSAWGLHVTHNPQNSCQIIYIKYASYAISGLRVINYVEKT